MNYSLNSKRLDRDGWQVCMCHIKEDRYGVGDQVTHFVFYDKKCVIKQKGPQPMSFVIGKALNIQRINLLGPFVCTEEIYAENIRCVMSMWDQESDRETDR